MIEARVIEYLAQALALPVSGTTPTPMPDTFLVVERVGGGEDDYIPRADIAVQSWAQTMAQAAALNERVKAAMGAFAERPDISRCHLDSDYNHTDRDTKRFRYQAIFEIVYF